MQRQAIIDILTYEDIIAPIDDAFADVLITQEQHTVIKISYHICLRECSEVCNLSSYFSYKPITYLIKL